MSAASEAYEAGLRAGYAHGYDVGLAHGRARASADLGDSVADEAAVRLDGPSRDELRARGRIPVDRTRPPALPVRLWQAEDWAKADERNLPTTDAGHAQWREAIADGRVPAHLADAYASALDRDSARVFAHLTGSARDISRESDEFADAVTRSVADTDQALAALRARLDATGPTATTPVVDSEALDRDQGLGR